MNTEEFDRYVKPYDMSDWMIDLKYHHTYRVVDYCIKIALSEGMNEHEVVVAGTAGLLHDIARFEQVRQFHTFYDKKSFDHGDYGYGILKNENYIMQYVDNEVDAEAVLKAVKYHNKKYLDADVTDYERKICQIARDADKLDIMDKQNNDIKDGSTKINEAVMKSIRNHKLIDNADVKTHADSIVRCLAFMFDFNFKQSFVELTAHEIVQRKFELLENYIDINQVKEIEDIIYKYIEEKSR